MDPAVLSQLTETVAVRAIRRADDQDHIDQLRKLLDRVLAVLRRVADIFLMRALDPGEAAMQRGDDVAALIDAERRLGHVREMLMVLHRQSLDVLDGGHEMKL